MDQAHEPKWENLGKCGLEGTKGDPSRVLARAPRLTPSLVVQSALGTLILVVAQPDH